MIELNPLIIEAQAFQLKSALEYQLDLTQRLEDTIEILESDIEELKTVIEYLEMRLGINNTV